MEAPQIKLGSVPESQVIDKVRLTAPNVSQAASTNEPPIKLGPVPKSIVIDKVRLEAPISASSSLGRRVYTVERALQLIEAMSANDIPLDPGVGGRSITVDALDVGDIILSTTSASVSRLIRWATNSSVSHSLLYIGNGEVIEAIGEGVARRSLTSALADATVAVAFRYPNLTAQQAGQIRDFATAQVGKRYDTMGIVRQARFQLDKRTWCGGLDGEARDRCIYWVGRVNFGTKSNDEFFCSELVVAAYQSAGVLLTTTPPSWTSPEDLVEMRFAQLGYVGHLKTP